MGSSQNLVLMSPTGSGKMLVIFLGILILRKLLQKPNGVGVGTQPLSTIMEEKLDSESSGPVTVGVVRWDGKLKTGDGQEMDVKLSHDQSKFTSGELACIMGHAESWNTPTGKQIIRDLKEKDNFILFFVDECHQGLTEHWEEIRPEMRSVPSCLQIHKSKGAPSVLMTATATEIEIETMQKDFGVREAVVLRENPVQSQYNFQVVVRPPTLYQTSGKYDSNGQFHEGLLSLLNLLYLNKFVECPEQAKECMMFFRTESYLMDVNDDLSNRLPTYVDPFSQPWVQYHGGIGEVTEKIIYSRRNQIKLWLTTTKSLMGIDLKGIKIVIFVRPLNMLHYFLQGAGRGGRKNKSCKREKVLVYILFNNSDVGENVPGMSKEVVNFLRSGQCLKIELSTFFGFEYSPCNNDTSWCCSNCRQVL